MANAGQGEREDFPEIAAHPARYPGHDPPAIAALQAASLAERMCLGLQRLRRAPPHPAGRTVPPPPSSALPAATFPAGPSCRRRPPLRPATPSGSRRPWEGSGPLRRARGPGATGPAELRGLPCAGPLRGWAVLVAPRRSLPACLPPAHRGLPPAPQPGLERESPGRGRRALAARPRAKRTEGDRAAVGPPSVSPGGSRGRLPPLPAASRGPWPPCLAWARADRLGGRGRAPAPRALAQTGAARSSGRAVDESPAPQR